MKSIGGSGIQTFDHGCFLLGQRIIDILQDRRCNNNYFGHLESVTRLDGTDSLTWRQKYVGLSGYIVLHVQSDVYQRLYFLIVDDDGTVATYLHASPGAYKIKNNRLIYRSATSVYTFALID